MFPGVPGAGLTGAAAFEDGQMHNPPRLVLAFAMAADQLGASVANYVEAESLLLRDKRVYGVAARDRLTGERFDIRARVVLNAAGPWAEGLLKGVSTVDRRHARHVLARRLLRDQSQAQRPVGAGASGRHTGCGRRAVARRPPSVHGALARQDARRRLALRRAARPGRSGADPRGAARLHRRDQCMPPRLQSARIRSGARGLRARAVRRCRRPGQLASSASASSRGSSIIGSRTGSPGSSRSISVRYTVARLDAVNALSCVMKQIYRKDLDPFNPAAVAASVENPERAARVRSASEPLPGGEFDDFERLLAHARRNRPLWVPPALGRITGRQLRHAHAPCGRDGGCRSIAAPMHLRQPRDACRSGVRRYETKWCSTMSRRRIPSHRSGHRQAIPGDAALNEVAAFMQQALGWSAQARAQEERRAVDEQFDRFLSATEPLRYAPHRHCPRDRGRARTPDQCGVTPGSPPRGPKRWTNHPEHPASSSPAARASSARS